MTRIDRICDHDFVEKNRCWLQRVARLNGIPDHVYARQLTAFNLRKTSPRTASDERDTPVRITITYYPGISERIRSILACAMEVVSKPRTIGSRLLARAKFQVEPQFKHAPVYCAFCTGCDKRYYGETEASIYQRFTTGHWAAIKGDRVNASALAQHEARNPGHRINPNVIVLFCEPSYHRRLLLEALAGRAELPSKSINFEWEASLDTETLPGTASAAKVA